MITRYPGQEYILYQSEFIEKHIYELKLDLEIAHRLFEEAFPGKDSTWSFDKYNIFSLTAPSWTFYQVYKELRTLVRSELGDTRDLWIQSWVNYHTQDQLLHRHHHEFEYHGYIAIEPKTTKTVFDDYEILNKPGQIYFGPGNRYHYVEATEPFDGIRTTIGFDIMTTYESSLVKYKEKPFSNNGLIPLL